MSASNENPEQPAVEPTKDEKTIGMLSHLLILFTGFVAPLIIWLLKKDESAYIAKQSREALNFSISITIAYFALFMITLLFGWIPILGWIIAGVALLAFLGVFIYSLVAIITACIRTNEGVDYTYAFCLRLIK